MGNTCSKYFYFFTFYFAQAFDNPHITYTHVGDILGILMMYSMFPFDNLELRYYSFRRTTPYHAIIPDCISCMCLAKISYLHAHEECLYVTMSVF